MAKMKISVVLDEELIAQVDAALPKRKRSAFVSQAVARELKRLRQEKLRQAYLEAYRESESESESLDGVSADGVD